MAADHKTLDLLAIGRSSVDLYGQQAGGRLEDMASFAKYVGGSPTNTAIGAARLGLSTALLTRVGADHMGRFIREQLIREGVDATSVVTDEARLTALVILGIRDSVSFPLIFYREDCADMALGAEDVDEDQVRSARAVLINGTHLSAPGVFEASLRAARLARASGGKVVFDIDYRPVLWGLTARDRGENRFVADNSVTDRLQSVLPLCDLVVGTEEEIHILGGSVETASALAAIRARTGALIVVKHGSDGCTAFPGPTAQGLAAPGFAIEVFNVLGAGDAFMAGFLSGWLRNQPLERCCVLANAAGAMVVSRHGCAPAMPTSAEMEHFLSIKDRSARLRNDVALEHLHWVTTRPGRRESLTVLAIDHRGQFEALAAQVGADPARIARFKALALPALDRVAEADPSVRGGLGLLIDGRFGGETLAAAADRPYWLGRPIEVPRSRPLLFEGRADVGAELAGWPTGQVVKALVLHHPDDETDLRDRQMRQLIRLFDACRATRHELLVEVIAPAGAPVDGETTARSLTQIYDEGVMPDWWKLEPSVDAGAWRKIEAVIGARDPHCRGVVLLGLSQSSERLAAAFEAAAGVEVVKGFAVGRTIFEAPARAWLADDIGDEAAIEAMAENFQDLVRLWRRARARIGLAA